MSSGCARRDIGWVLGKKFFTGRLQALEQSAQGSCGVTIPGGISEMDSCGPWEQFGSFASGLVSVGLPV